MSSAYDLVIENGILVDGTGAPAVPAALAIRNGRIARIELSPLKAPSVLDASGCIVAPGFIDIHSHSDCYPLVSPSAASKVHDGVTTEIAGNCGVSPFPMAGRFKQQEQEYFEKFGLDIDWSNIDEYWDRARQRGTAINRAFLVGHGSVRSAVMDYADRAPTPDELAQMKDHVRRAMEHGAIGLSTGLIYPPGCYAKADEIVALCRVVAEYDGVYASHIRSEGDRLEDAIEEALDISRRSGARLQISHLKVAGEANWPKIEWLKEKLWAEHEKGVDFACDRYPYIASSTGLETILPEWACAGGIDEEIGRLTAPGSRAKIKTEVMAARRGDKRWQQILIAHIPVEGMGEFEGRTIAAIAEEQGKDPIDAAFDLLIEARGQVSVVIFSMAEENLREILSWPFVMVGSDAAFRETDGLLSVGKPHPRTYGTFARVLGKYVREEKVLSLEQALHKMTLFPAERAGLKERGALRPGWHADVVVFDPDAITDRATFESPHQYSAGIKYVIVNGKVALADGEQSESMHGEILKR
ncbi:MAG: D-aminoacylase [Planctomycetes bacterium]|nr:D-aminoacylase [Planctomycetota bacterium]